MFHGGFKPSGQIFSGGGKEKGRKELRAYALSRGSPGKCPRTRLVFPSRAVKQLAKENLLVWLWPGSRSQRLPGFLSAPEAFSAARTSTPWTNSLHASTPVPSQSTPKASPFFFFAAEKLVGPRDLYVSEHSHSSLRLTWMPATGRVTGYRVHLHPLLPSGRLVSEEQRQVESRSRFVEHWLQVAVVGVSLLPRLLMAQPG